MVDTPNLGLDSPIVSLVDPGTITRSEKHLRDIPLSSMDDASAGILLDSVKTNNPPSALPIFKNPGSNGPRSLFLCFLRRSS